MKRQRSIKWKLIFFVSTISTLPVIILGSLVIYFSGNQLEEEINTKNLLLSKIFINQIEKYIDGPLKDLESVANVIKTKGFGKSSEIIFEELLDRHEYFVKFVFTNSQGYVNYVFPEDSDLIQSDLSRRNFFTEVNKSGESYWSSAFISTPDNVPVTALSIPIEGGILTTHLDLSYLSKITKELSDIKDIIVSVTDQTGTYLAHSKSEKVLQREVEYQYNNLRQQNSGEIYRTKMKHDGDEFVCHVGFVRQTGWLMMISQPFRQTYLPVKRLLWSTVALTVLLLAVSVVISYRYGLALKNTLDKFLENTVRISEGKYGSSIADVKYSEFNQLADSIFTMAQKIEQREKDILESQAMFRAIFQAETVGMSIIKPDLSFQMVNNKWSEITGFQIEELDDKTLLTFINEENQEETKENLEALFQGKHGNTRQEKRLTRSDGTVIWVYHSMALIGSGEDSRFLVGMLIDITEQKAAQLENQQLQSKLQQSHKMEAVGMLAGGIAHDFNNILAAILGYVELAAEDVEPNSELQDHLLEIEKAGTRAKDLVKQILAFSRQVEVNPSLTHPEEIVHDALKMLRPSIPTSIEITTEIDSDIGLINANPSQIHQVVVNLCTNSFHAMEDQGGSLKITLKQVALVASELPHVPQVKDGFYARLIIQDSGPGIPEDVREKIFDPYFTTKKFGKGTGMGLSIVHGIIAKHGGFIALDEEHVDGASFSVYLPLIREEENYREIDTSQVESGDEHILFVDDEDMLRNLAKNRFEKIGYKITICNDGEHAYTLFSKNPDEYDIIITDQTMPKMTGIELTKKIITVRDNIPIILCTGYSSTVNREEATALGVKTFLYKPYNFSDLIVSIREILDRKAL